MHLVYVSILLWSAESDHHLLPLAQSSPVPSTAGADGNELSSQGGSTVIVCQRELGDFRKQQKYEQTEESWKNSFLINMNYFYGQNIYEDTAGISVPEKPL